MSTAALNWAFQAEVSPPGRKLVLVALADQAQDCGHLWPAMRVIAAKATISERQARAHIAALVEAGLVIRERQFRQQGGYTANRYRVLITDPAPCGACLLADRKQASARDRKHTSGGDRKPASGPNKERTTSNEPTGGWDARADAHTHTHGTLPGYIVDHWESEIGVLTPRAHELISDWVNNQVFVIPLGWVCEAFTIAVENNARRWHYVRSILDRWATQGKDDGRKGAGPGGRSRSPDAGDQYRSAKEIAARKARTAAGGRATDA